MFNKYPYTDFHELNLDWFLSEFKTLVTEWDAFAADVAAEWPTIKNDWNALYNYVHNYFDNLDVQEEIDNKLDEMVQDGTMQALVQPFLDQYGADIINMKNSGLTGNVNNIWPNTQSLHTFATGTNGGNFMVRAYDGDRPADCPITSGTFIAVRQSFTQFSGSSPTHGVVLLYEIYPKASRIWISTYNSSWSQWYVIAEDYAAGDTVTLSNYTELAGVWISTSELRFLVPLTHPINASSATIAGSMFMRTNGNSSGEVNFSTVTQNTYLTECGLVVRVTFASAPPTAVQYQPCIIQTNNFSITFA